jgi:hypothetical protein
MPFPDICVEDKRICPNELPTLRFQQQTCGEATLNLKDHDGCPYPLDAAIHEVCFIAKDRYASQEFLINTPVEILNGEEGQVRLTVTEEQTHDPGLWLGEFIVTQIAEPTSDASSSSSPMSSSSAPFEPKVIKRFPCYLESEQNLEHMDASVCGISIAEVRLALRDRCAADNFLLDNVQFTDTEIAWAIRRPVDQWNETPPPLNPIYTPRTFPYRYHWIDAIAAELLVMASHNEERNRLPYTAANLSVDDRDTAQFYLAAARSHRDRWHTWMLRQKKALNMALAYGRTDLRSYGNKGLTFDNSGRALY